MQIFSSPLELAHHYWKLLVHPQDTLIDATCGNGKDTLVLSQLLGEGGHLFSLDIQQEALDRAHSLLSQNLTPEALKRVTLLKQSHTIFPEAPNIKLIVYNLGYLPGGNKQLTTQTETTLISLRKALSLISSGGAISITCYPGHAEGAKEELAITSLTRELPSHAWNICYHQWTNRPSSPSLFFIQKRTA